MINKQLIDDLEKKIPVGETRTRFAPSPTGYMHVGNLRTALYTYLIARHDNGKFILRIEDTDQKRQVEGAVDLIYKTMKECGLTHDEGPDIGGPVAPYIQSERRAMYKEYAELLVENGNAYRCFCDKCEDEGTGKPETDFEHLADPCRSIKKAESDERAANGDPYVIRQLIPSEGKTTFHDEIFGDITVENNSLDDQILLKRDGLPTYNFANVVDDHLYGITHVVRGTEYLSSAPKYNLLYESFGWNIPKYIHCSPVMRDEHNKMSKRHGDPSYEDLKNQGYITEAIVNYVALLGWSPKGEQEIFNLKELEDIFDINGLSKSPAIFDIDKLKAFNAQYIRDMDIDSFTELAKPYILEGINNADLNIKEIAELLHQRTEVLTDIPEKLGFFAQLPDYESEIYIHKKSKSTKETSLDVLNKMVPIFEAVEDWTNDNILDAMKKLVEQMECKNALVMWPVRIAAAGQTVTPGGAVEICHIIGKEETLRRIKIGIEKLSA